MRVFKSKIGFFWVFNGVLFLISMSTLLTCCGVNEFDYRNICPQRRSNNLGGSCQPYDELIFISLSYKACLVDNDDVYCADIVALVGLNDEDKLSDDCSCFGESYFAAKKNQNVYWCSVGKDFLSGTSDDICFDGMIRFVN